MDLAHVERAWPGILSAIHEQSPPTRGFLEGTRPIAVTPDEVTLGVPSRVSLKMLEGPDHRSRVAHALGLALGGTVAVTFELVAAAAPEPPPEDLSREEHDRVLREQMRELFGAVEESDGGSGYGQGEGEAKGAG
jgi:hypothetical protein